MKKIITTKKDYIFQSIPCPDGLPDKILVKHRSTNISHIGEDFRITMDIVLDKLSERYGWKVLFREEVSPLF